jgi:diadenylate cyclase
MPELVTSILDQVTLTTLIDIGLVALLIYWLFSLIRGTRAVRLIIGVSVLFVVYFLAQWLNLQLLTQILQTGAVVGLFAVVVIFQPELRRALERIGRVGSFSWLVSPTAHRAAENIASEVSRAAAALSRDRHGALIVIERETGLEEHIESGVTLHADLSAELLLTIFWPKTTLHDGAVILRDEEIVAAAVFLPAPQTTIHTERFGTRHRAALGITEQSDAICVVVSEETGLVSLVERARIVRNLGEAQLARSLRSLLMPADRRTILSGGSILGRGGRNRSDLSRLLGRGGAPAAATSARGTTTPGGTGPSVTGKSGSEP